jgi:hypothetical protein
MSNNKPVEVIFRKVAVADNTTPSGVAYSVTSIVDVNTDYDGEIPYEDTQLFLHRYSDDSFVRVCNVGDIDIYPKFKKDGYEFYRKNSFIVKYQDLSVAVASLPVIRDRVSSVVSLRLELLGTFNGVTQPVDLPYDSTSESSKESYKSKYTESRDARKQLDESIVADNNAYAISQEKYLAYSKLNSWLSDLVPKLQLASSSISDFTTLSNWLGTSILNSLDTYITEVEGQASNWSVGKSDLLARLNSIKSTIDSVCQNNYPGKLWTVTLTSVSDDVATSTVVTLKSFLDTLYYSFSAQSQPVAASVIVLSNDASSKLSQLKEKQVALDDASALEQKALSDIARYCPDIDINKL